MPMPLIECEVIEKNYLIIKFDLNRNIEKINTLTLLCGKILTFYWFTANKLSLANDIRNTFFGANIIDRIWEQ